MTLKTFVRPILWLICPYVIVILIHLAIPVILLIDSSSKAENYYNIQKFDSQLASITSMSILFASTIQNRIQVFQQIRESQFDIFLSDENTFIDVNISKIQTNFAGDPNIIDVISSTTMNRSMWYAENVSSQSELSSIQLQYLNRYKSVQGFIEAAFSPYIKDGLKIQVIVEQPAMMFLFPSQYDKRFQTTNYSVFNSEYMKITNNFKLNKKQFIVFAYGEKFRLCNILLTSQQISKGTFCFELNTTIFANQLASNVVYRQTQSIFRYYLLTPIYDNVQIKPQILFNFTNNNPNNISYPLAQYINLQSDMTQYFNISYSYRLFIHQSDIKNKIIVCPVKIKDIHKNSVILYIMADKYFQQVSVGKFQVFQTLLIVFIPSLVLILLSVIVISLTVFCLLNGFQTAISTLNGLCNHIIKGQLDIIIPQYEETKDLRKLYRYFNKVNLLYKVSSQDFYNGSIQEVLTKYFRVLDIFEGMNYDTSSVTESIGGCYYNMGDSPSAAKYFQKSIKFYLDELYPKYGSFLEMIKNKKKLMENKSFENIYKILKRKIIKLLFAKLFPQVNPQDQDIQRIFLCFKKMSKREIYTKIYIHMLALQCRYCHCTGKISRAIILTNQYELILNKLIKLQKKQKLSKWEIQYKLVDHLQQVEHPLDIFLQILNLMKGVTELLTGNLSQAAHFIIASLQYSQRFRPFVANTCQIFLKQIFQPFGLLNEKILSTVYFKDHCKRQTRQVIMLFQWAKKKNSSKQQVNLWKKTAISKAKWIFNTFLYDDDRLSVVKFDQDPETVCTLTRLKTCRRLLLHNLTELQKTKMAKQKPNLQKAFVETLQRTKQLKQIKYLIVFINQCVLQPEKIQKLFCSYPTYKIVVLEHNQQPKNRKSKSYFLLSMKAEQDFERVFSHKIDLKFLNTINPF